MDAFTDELLTACDLLTRDIFAWCVLPNHYHLLVHAPVVKALLEVLGKLHGRSSYAWNGEENLRGRQVFYRSVEREIRSDRHFWATLNYVHHNPVRHGYVERWQEWPWSSAGSYLEGVGRAEALRIWKAYPVREYGAGWDDADM